jgi:hypothetical protein
MITMTKTPYTAVEQKTTLTFACMYLDWNIRSQIIKFNRSNSDYRIEVEDYSEYNTNDDYTAGLTKLTTEIISGKVPDILDTQPADPPYARRACLKTSALYRRGHRAGGEQALSQPCSMLCAGRKAHQSCRAFRFTPFRRVSMWETSRLAAGRPLCGP